MQIKSSTTLRNHYGKISSLAHREAALEAEFSRLDGEKQYSSDEVRDQQIIRNILGEKK